MAQASDGRMFSGRQAMLSHERKIKGAGGQPMKSDPLAMPGQGGGMDDGMQSEDPAQVVQQHGPATRVETTHDHAAGKHHVHSEHGDGHTHESDHASAEEAGEHAKKLGMDSEAAPESDGMDDAEYE